MDRDPMPGSDRPVDGEVAVASRLRVLFTVVKVVYKRWAEGAIASDAIKEIYSSTWLDMFEPWLSQGVQVCRTQIVELVDWSDEDGQEGAAACRSTGAAGH